MKRRNLYLMLALLFTYGLLFAQSDYQKVQNFKNEVAQIQSAIKNAASKSEFKTIMETIQMMKERSAENKELLDKSLYPEDYQSTFAKLENELELRRGDFSQIEDLQTEVITYKNEIEKLNDKNTELLSKINEFQSVGGKDAQSIAEMKRLVNNLRNSLKQRDELVRSIVDSLLSDFVQHPMTLNDMEKQKVYDKVETENLFYNIEKTVRDNMDFLKATQLTADDLSEIKEDQLQFYNMWKKIGPQLANIYVKKKEKAGEVAYITNLFAQWNQKLDKQIWENIYQVFRKSNIKVTPFVDGTEFTNNIIDFINQSKLSASQEVYTNFEDSVWTNQLRATWIPILIDNEMLLVEQRDLIQESVDDWGTAYGEKTPIYWYVAIAIIVIVFLLVFVPKWKKRNKPLAEQ